MSLLKTHPLKCKRETKGIDIFKNNKAKSCLLLIAAVLGIKEWNIACKVSHVVVIQRKLI